MKKLFTHLFFFFCTLQLHLAKADYWTQLSNFPGPVREVSSSFTIGNRGYVCCGYNGANLNDLWEFNSLTNLWTQKASLPAAGRAGAASFSINDKGYVCMGTGETRDLLEYDPVNNAWTNKADFPGVSRGFAAAFSIGSKGYVGLGGNNGTLSDFWEWDQTTDTWIQKNNFPGIARGYLVCFVINGKGYITTGLSANTYLNDCWQYDPVSDSWTQMADLPAPGRVDASAFTICDKGYLGTGGEAPYYNDFWEFDPAANQWVQKANVPGGGRDDCAYFSIGNKGYLGLGQLMGVDYATDFWEYIPDDDCIVPPAAAFSVPNSLCPGTCLSIENLSQNATSYQWSFPGASTTSSTSVQPATVCYNSPGSYDVMLVASNSVGSDTLLITGCITVFPFPLPQAIQQNGDTLISHQGFATYQWYFNGEAVNGATDYFFVAPDSGDYNVISTDTNGCEVEAAIFDVHIGIEEVNADREILIYPNPATGQLFIKCYSLLETPAEVTVYNIHGKIINIPDPWISNTQHTTLAIDVSALPESIYFIEIKAGGKIMRAKFVKE